MRLLYVHECFGSQGGAEANVLDTARELSRRGHQVALVSRLKSGRGEAEWTKVFGSRTYFPESEAAWRGIVEAEHPDAVYIHKWDDGGSIEQILGAGVPVIRMVHDHDLYCLRSYKYNPFTRRICTRPATGYCIFPCLAPIQRNRGGSFPIRFASYGDKIRQIELNRKLHRLVVASDYMKHELEINAFDPARIEVLPPVPPPDAGGESSFGGRNLLLYVGQIVRGKGVDVLMRALARVHGPFEAIVAGDGSHRTHCEKLCKSLGLEARVKFTGFLTQEQIAPYYREATAVLVSSVWPEPFGLVGVEAMRRGLPVVAFDAGGIRDWLHDGENGFLISWMDEVAYANAVDRLLKDKALARSMGERGRARAAADYDFEKYVSKLEKLLSEAG